MLLQIISNPDSVIIKLDAIQHSIKLLNDKISTSQWLPIATAILGAVLVWVGQFIERNYKKKQELSGKILNIYSGCEQILFKIKNFAKDAAFEKCMREYWYYCHVTELNAKDGDSEQTSMYYAKYVASTETASNYVSKIKEELAIYYSNVAEFNFFVKTPVDKTIVTKLQQTCSFNDPPYVDSSLTEQQALVKTDENTTDLTNQYISILSPLDRLNTEMENITQKFIKKK
jgi:hypothetical protein